MKQLVLNKDIRYLYHFTRVRNLRSILKKGLLPRDVAEERVRNLVVNDEERHDGQTDANCISISFPNYKMFYKLQNDFPDEVWAVMKIKPEILWMGECAFCRENAASNSVTCVPIAHRKRKDAFLKLFENYPGKPSRDELGLPVYYPTNPQAEILYFGIINPSQIMSIHFKDKQSCRNGRRTLNGIRKKRSWILLKYGESKFLPRFDWEAWQ